MVHRFELGRRDVPDRRLRLIVALSNALSILLRHPIW